MLYVPALSNGGAERVAALLATGFHEAGWRTTLMVDTRDDANAGLVSPGVTVVVLGRSHAAATVALARGLRRMHPDVAIGIGGVANLKLAAAHGLACERLPIVLTYHGRSDVGRGRLGQLAYRWAAPLARRAAAVVCVSDGLVEHLRDDWGVPREKLTRIYNPVPVERALPVSRSDLQRRPPIVASVGRLSPEKGFGALIAALSRIRPDARLVIHGEGGERDALLALARDRGVADRVELAGYSRDPWPCYARARCFALASPREAFGNVVVEALASGLPVVATRSGGPDEILDGGRFGTLVNNGDEGGLAAALETALADPGDPAPRVAHARTFAVEVAIGHYLDLFRPILAP